MSSSGEKGFAYLGLGRMGSFSLCHPLLGRRENLPRNYNACLNITESEDAPVLWHYDILDWSLRRWKKIAHAEINASQTLSIPPLFPSTPLSLPQLHPPQPVTPPPHLSPLLWQVETLIIDFLFSLLSSVHSLQRLPTYLALTEQCCSRRALKDRLDCLGILIPHFFILLGLCVPVL